MDMNLQKYAAFVKAVEYGSFSAAAEKLNYSQSGISRMIGDLEADWGITLLERGKSGVSLTSDGLKLLPLAENLLAAYGNLQAEAENLNGLQTGIIRIGTISSIATYRLPKIISRFQADYPKIEFELLVGDYSDVESQLAGGRVDCGFLRLPCRDDFDSVFLEQDELMAVLPQNHPLAGAEKFPISEFCNEPFMLLEKDAKSDVSALFEQCGLSPDVRFTTLDDYAIMSMVEAGLGISILPNLILTKTAFDVLKKPLDVPAHRNLGVALKSKKSASPAVKRFLECLI